MHPLEAAAQEVPMLGRELLVCKFVSAGFSQICQSVSRHQLLPDGPKSVLPADM